MKLLTKSDMAKLESQDMYHPGGPGRELTETESMVFVKFFTPDSSFTWYAVSASRDPQSGDVQFYGLVDSHMARELGYFWLSEISKVRGPFGLPVERDLYFTPVPLAELL
jgi:hypothetical protein